MTQSKIPFDMEAALKALREGQDLTGKDGNVLGSGLQSCKLWKPLGQFLIK